jgi:pimeloyl-ACP methyl ester carboxylesterase
MATAIINDAELYYDVQGRGVPLLLLAGLTSGAQSWQPVVKDLAKHYLVITVDSSRTKSADPATNIKQMADDCFGLVRHLGFSSVNLLGHALGGFVGQNCAIRYPGIVDKLILTAVAARNSARNNALFADWASCLESGIDLNLWIRNLFYWVLSRRFFENEAAVRQAVRLAVENLHPQSKASFRNQVRAAAKFDGSARLSRISSKTLVLCGKEDLLFPPDECAQLAAAIPGASLVVIDDAAHSIHMENPRPFVERILDFLYPR